MNGRTSTQWYRREVSVSVCVMLSLCVFVAHGSIPIMIVVWRCLFLSPPFLPAKVFAAVTPELKKLNCKVIFIGPDR